MNFIKTFTTKPCAVQPTAKKIIKLSQNQLQELIKLTNIHKAQQTVPQYISPATFGSVNQAPLITKNTCGLFNNADIQIDIDKGEPNLDELDNIFNSDDLINDSNEISFQTNLMETAIEQNPNISESKFAKKLKSLDMKIKIPTPQTQSVINSPILNLQEMASLDLKLTEEEWAKIFPSEIFGCDTASLEKALQEGDLFNEPPQNEPTFATPFVFDHEYTRSEPPVKRRQSALDETSQDSFASFDSATNAAPKKQRKRGIYRADDVTNQEDLQNYLERRKKNNLSSKASRANKKNLYNEMDAKSDFLEKENQRLRDKQVKLERVTKEIKDFLIEKFAGK
jgi:hypothetical protein